jgi:hypothetical protein
LKKSPGERDSEEPSSKMVKEPSVLCWWSRQGKDLYIGMCLAYLKNRKKLDLMDKGEREEMRFWRQAEVRLHFQRGIPLGLCAKQFFFLLTSFFLFVFYVGQAGLKLESFLFQLPECRYYERISK